MNLVFYDGKCALCDGVVRFLWERDIRKEFVFAPLEGKTAEKELGGLDPALRGRDSFVLIEGWGGPRPRFYFFAKGAFRVLWLLGGAWRVVGVLNFLPGYFFDWVYRLVARNRGLFLSDKSCLLPRDGDASGERFLP